MSRLVYLAPCAVVLAACGGSGNSGTTTSVSPIVSAAEKTRLAGSELVSVSGTVTLGSGKSLQLTGKGAFDQQSNRGVLHTTLTSPDNESTPLEEIFSGTKIWLNSPLFSSIFSPGKSWLEIDVASSAQKLGFDFKGLTGQTPGDALTELERTSSSVTKVGTETVGGLSTTHYRAAIDPAKVPAGDPVQQLTGAKYKSIDVWVDGQGLVRRVQLDYTAKADPTKAARAHIVLQMTLTKFGTSVTATPPSADATIDAGDSGKVGG